MTTTKSPPTDKSAIPELRAEKFDQAEKELEAQIQRLESLAAKTTDIAVKQETLDKINGLKEKLSEMRDNK